MRAAVRYRGLKPALGAARHVPRDDNPASFRTRRPQGAEPRLQPGNEALVALLILFATPVLAQTTEPATTRASTTVPVPGACESPRTGPADAPGCYLAGTAQLGPGPTTPLYWHLDAFPTAAAAEAARGATGTVVSAHGRTWLFTLAGAEWRAAGGSRVARVGPLPVTPGRGYSVRYLDGVVPPAARTPAHRHAGPEAWYVLEGTNCLETTEGTQVASAGESLIVPEGPVMILTGVGSTLRRTLTLVLHDPAQHWTIPVQDWVPAVRCPSDA